MSRSVTVDSASRPLAPLVDVGGLGAADDDRRRATIRAMAEAIERSGVFVATGIAGGEGLDQRAATLLRFFELPDATKRAVATRRQEPSARQMYRGYFATNPARRFAYSEFFDIGPDRPMATPDLVDAQMFAEPNAWPDEEPVPGWRASMMAHFACLEALGLALLDAIASVVGLSKAEIDARFAEGNSTLRLIRYPVRPPGPVIDEAAVAALGHDAHEPPMAIGRHTDGCALSLLWQREPGLQGQGPDGTWYEVPSVANSVSVHLGDMVELLTDGRLRATPHRVFARDEERCSIGFFLEPKLMASCAPVGQPDRGDLDTYAALLLRRFSRYPGYEGSVHDPDLG